MSTVLDPSRAGPTPRPARPTAALGLVLLLAFAVVGAHALTNLYSPYGVHRDEFLYLAMGRHLRLWAMDFPPMIALLAEWTRGVLGSSLVAIRLPSAVAHALLIFLAALLAREFGGGRFAQALAALAVALDPLFLRAGNLFQPVVLDQLWWTVGLLLLARVGRAGRGGAARAYWLLFGVACGLGLLTKFSILFLGVGALAGILLSPLRGWLRTPWPWLAAAVALALGSPSIVGQVQLGFPVVQQMRDLRGSQLVHVGYADFLLEQAVMLGPLLLLALAGLVRLVAAPSMRPYRAVGWSCAASFVVLWLLHGKGYYIGPIYPALLGAGAAAVGLGLEALRARGFRRIAGGLGALAVAVVLAFGVAALPFGLPVLPPPTMARYAAAAGATRAVTTNRGTQLPLPEDYADMLGWEEQAAAVARVYSALPPADRADAVVIADNYGEAGAIDFYARRYGLPGAIAPIGSYWFFGPGPKPGRVAIVMGSTREELLRYFREVEPAGRVTSTWAVERDVPLWIGRDPYRTLQQIWPEFAGRN
ncbi:MAG: glycosyltransferase family 39 protein [Gemmatimonadetes bacterium]|nr:glycosyltransferase family 39 protein [Gemmatimonadota bacterium]